MNKDGREIDFFGKFILLSNNEENFVYASEDDIRYWVRKVPVPLTDEIGLLGKMIEEIPYFLRYLSQRKLHSESKSRMWFHPDLIKTNALRKVIENSKPTIEKELRSTLRDMFLDFGLDKIEMTKMHIRQYLLNNKFEVNYIEKVLRENLKADVVRDWMIAPDAIHEQYRGKENTLPEGYRWNAEIQKIEVGVSKVKRGSFPVWQTTINDNKEMDQKVVDIKFNGRPYVFHREDYVSSSDASYVAGTQTTKNLDGTDETSEIDTSIINPDEDTKDLPF